MKKLQLASLLVVACFVLVNGQTMSGNGPERDNYMGYLIKVLPTPGNGYGYDLFFKGRMVLHEPINPFTMSHIGLTSKEDVLKVAHWQIEQFWRTGNRGIPRRNVMISNDVAQQLKIITR